MDATIAKPLTGPFTERLEAARDGREWKWVQDKTGISYDRLRRIREGSKPTLDEAVVIARAFERPLADFYA